MCPTPPTCRCSDSSYYSCIAGGGDHHAMQNSYGGSADDQFNQEWLYRNEPTVGPDSWSRPSSSAESTTYEKGPTRATTSQSLCGL